MAVLDRFGVDDLVALGADLRSLGDGDRSMEEVAGRVVELLRDRLLADDGRPSCITVRLYKTHPLRRLPDDRRALALEAAPDAQPDTTCITLLGRADAVPLPVGGPAERVRPLTAEAFTSGSVVVRLLQELGVDEASVLDPKQALAMQMQHRELNVFVIHDFPDTELMDEGVRDGLRALGVRDLFTLGGILPSGDLFLLLAFTRSAIDERVADLLRSLGTAVKVPLIPFTFKVFAPPA